MEQAIKENILMQITNASQMVKLEKDPHAAFALIIDGKTLTYALEDDMKNQFLGLAVDCASVLCCRVSPKQKALVCALCIWFWFGNPEIYDKEKLGHFLFYALKKLSFCHSY